MMRVAILVALLLGGCSLQFTDAKAKDGASSSGSGSGSSSSGSTSASGSSGSSGIVCGSCTGLPSCSIGTDCASGICACGCCLPLSSTSGSTSSGSTSGSSAGSSGSSGSTGSTGSTGSSASSGSSGNGTVTLVLSNGGTKPWLAVAPAPDGVVPLAADGSSERWARNHGSYLGSTVAPASQLALYGQSVAAYSDGAVIAESIIEGNSEAGLVFSSSAVNYQVVTSGRTGSCNDVVSIDGGSFVAVGTFSDTGETFFAIASPSGPFAASAIPLPAAGSVYPAGVVYQPVLQSPVAFISGWNDDAGVPQYWTATPASGVLCQQQGSPYLVGLAAAPADANVLLYGRNSGDRGQFRECQPDGGLTPVATLTWPDGGPGPRINGAGFVSSGVVAARTVLTLSDGGYEVVLLTFDRSSGRVLESVDLGVPETFFSSLPRLLAVDPSGNVWAVTDAGVHEWTP